MSFISKTALFRGCTEEDILNMAEHLDFRTAQYRKGDVIFSAGSIVTDIGLVLSGSDQIEHTDLWGNKSILGINPTGGVFAESYACIPNEPMMVDAVANEKCEILFISVPKLFMPCSVCGSQNRLIQNLVMISSEKNLQPRSLSNICSIGFWFLMPRPKSEFPIIENLNLRPNFHAVVECEHLPAVQITVA